MSKEKDKPQLFTEENCIQFAIDNYLDFKNLVGLLTKNGYTVTSSAVFKKYPENGLDYYIIRIPN